MPESAKTHLQQSRISKFSGEDPRTPLFKGRGGKRKGGEEREEKDREGRGGTGRYRGGKEGGRGGMGGSGEGRGGALDMGSAPLETSSGAAHGSGAAHSPIWVKLNRAVCSSQQHISAKLHRNRSTFGRMAAEKTVFDL